MVVEPAPLEQGPAGSWLAPPVVVPQALVLAAYLGSSVVAFA